MNEPNRLRDEAPPNAPLLASPSARPGTTAARAPSVAQPARRVSRSLVLVVAGVVLGIAGIPLFFGPEGTPKQFGIGLMSLGFGITLTVLGGRLILEAVAAARKSRMAAVGVVVLAPHLVLLAVAGCALIAFGLVTLVGAFGAS